MFDQGFSHALNIVKAKSDRLILHLAFTRAVIDIDWQKFNMMMPCIVHNDAFIPEAHRLVIEQRSIKSVWVITLQPCTLVHQHCKGSSMALSKGIVPKCPQCFKNSFSNLK